jgi:CheY-like chemotaxis protein
MPAKNSYSSASSAALDAAGKDFKPQTAKISQRAAEDCSQIRVLSISRNAEDHTALRRILSGLPWVVSAAANCQQAVKQLCREKISLIFCESLLEDGTWKNILGQIRLDSHPPLLVVTSRVADEHLWAEVLNLGGYDVLAKPFNPEEVRHVCTTASLWLMQLSAPRRTAAAG